ncbi:DUF2288 family protein [Lentisphaera marina]|uniref:DUF2288 family protein n=1 Tax=Lentisphaera marina TaxID=1111041 RepID=UPI0023671D51|nr:DUF2288 family protein [Lentisphaera marina]MDD7985825.1 DUF2288 family protein [Lentisphaera marina]
MNEKLLKEADWCEWADLHDSFIRDMLFAVEEGGDIFSLAEAIASNDTEIIGKAIETGRVFRPDGYQVEQWRKDKLRFLTLIVSPFVIIQEMDMASYAKILKQQAEVLKKDQL